MKKLTAISHYNSVTCRWRWHEQPFPSKLLLKEIFFSTHFKAFRCHCRKQRRKAVVNKADQQCVLVWWLTYWNFVELTQTQNKHKILERVTRVVVSSAASARINLFTCVKWTMWFRGGGVAYLSINMKMVGIWFFGLSFQIRFCSATQLPAVHITHVHTTPPLCFLRS